MTIHNRAKTEKTNNMSSVINTSTLHGGVQSEQEASPQILQLLRVQVNFWLCSHINENGINQIESSPKIVRWVRFDFMCLKAELQEEIEVHCLQVWFRLIDVCETFVRCSDWTEVFTENRMKNWNRK